jgi:uncharacterized protein YwgA
MEDINIYISTIEKYILLLLGIDKKPIKIRTYKDFDVRLFIQKVIFLLSQDIPELKEEISFKPYKYGPYDETVHNALLDLSSDGFITINTNKEYSEITLTNKGYKICKELEESTDKSIITIVKDVRELVEDLDIYELLALIYYSFPEYAKYSDIKGIVDKKRVELAKSLYKKKKISLGKALEIADFININKQE